MLGTINKEYVSGIAFLDEREIMNQVLDIRNEEYSFLDIMELMGMSQNTSQPTYHHFKNRELYEVETIKTGSTPTDNSGGSGSDYTIQLSNTVSGASTPRVGSLIQFPNGTVGYVYSKTDNAAGDQLGVKAVDGSDLQAAADQKLSIFSNASGEGSVAPDPQRWGMDKSFNQVQIFKDSYRLTDVQLASTIEVEYKGQRRIVNKAAMESLMKFRGDIAHAMLLSRISDENFTNGAPTLVDDEGNPVQTTRGLNQYIEDEGSLFPAATVNQAFFENLSKQLDKTRVTSDMWLFMGGTPAIEFDNYLNGLSNAGTLSQAGGRFSLDGRNLDFGVDTFRLYNRTYGKKRLPLLDHKNTVNFTGSAGFEKVVWGVPNDKVKVHGGSGSANRFQIRYLDIPEAPASNVYGNAKYREIHTGGLAPGYATDTRSVLQCTFEARMGFELLGANQCVKITLA